MTSRTMEGRIIGSHRWIVICANWVARAYGELAQGGGLGIMGDSLFGQENRFGQLLPETIAGPVMGEAAQGVMQMWNNAREAALTGDSSKLDKLPSEGLRLGLQNTPFVNLFYLRGALNYMAPSTPILGMFNPANHLRTFGC